MGEAGLLGGGGGQGRHPREQDGDPEAGRVSGCWYARGTVCLSVSVAQLEQGKDY